MSEINWNLTIRLTCIDGFFKLYRFLNLVGKKYLVAISLLFSTSNETKQLVWNLTNFSWLLIKNFTRKTITNIITVFPTWHQLSLFRAENLLRARCEYFADRVKLLLVTETRPLVQPDNQGHVNYVVGKGRVSVQDHFVAAAKSYQGDRAEKFAREIMQRFPRDWVICMFVRK